jgi:hypothetical protein
MCSNIQGILNDLFRTKFFVKFLPLCLPEQFESSIFRSLPRNRIPLPWLEEIYLLASSRSKENPSFAKETPMRSLQLC